MIESWNNSVFLYINQFAGVNPWVDSAAIAAAELLPLLFIAVLLYLWFGGKEKGRESALLSGYGAIMGISINGSISLFYVHPRPFIHSLGTTLISHAPDSSFPSDHTTFLLSIAISLFLIPSLRRPALLLVLLGIAGGLARVFCGVHFPLDIAGSLFVSILSSALIWRERNRLAPLNQFIIGLYLNPFRYKEPANGSPEESAPRTTITPATSSSSATPSGSRSLPPHSLLLRPSRH